MHKDKILWRKFLDRAESTTIRSLERYAQLKHQYPGGIDDHGMERYIRLIKKNLTKKDKKPTFLNYINS